MCVSAPCMLLFSHFVLLPMLLTLSSDDTDSSAAVTLWTVTQHWLLWQFDAEYQPLTSYVTNTFSVTAPNKCRVEYHKDDSGLNVTSWMHMYNYMLLMPLCRDAQAPPPRRLVRDTWQNPLFPKTLNMQGLVTYSQVPFCNQEDFPQPNIPLSPIFAYAWVSKWIEDSFEGEHCRKKGHSTLVQSGIVKGSLFEIFNQTPLLITHLSVSL